MTGGTAGIDLAGHSDGRVPDGKFFAVGRR